MIGTCGAWRPEVMDMQAVQAELTLEKAFAQVMDKLINWGVIIIKMLPNLVVAVIVLILFWVLSIPVARVVERSVLRLSKFTHIARLMARLTRMAVMAGAIVLALNALNLDKAVASLLAGVGILGLAFGFASKDIAANFMAGILLHFVHPFRTGDFIKVGEFLVYVDSLEMRATVCHNQQGQRIIIPNQTILGAAIINYTVTGIRRVDITCSIDYTNDLQQAEELAIKAVESLELRNQERPIELFYETYNGTTISFMIRFWTEPEQKVFLQAQSDAIKAINRTFKKHDITMSSTQVSLDFGPGESLRKQLEGLKIPLPPPEERKSGKGKTGGKEVQG